MKGRRLPAFRRLVRSDWKCAARTSARVHRQGETKMVRPSIRHRELHLNKRICRPSSVKCSRTRSSAASAVSRSPAIPASAKRVSIFHNLLAQPGFDRHRRDSLNSRSMPFTSHGQMIAIPKRPQLDAYGSRATTRSASTSFTPRSSSRWMETSSDEIPIPASQNRLLDVQLHYLCGFRQCRTCNATLAERS